MSLKGKKVVFTGKMSQTRVKMKKEAEAAGMDVDSAVSSNTDLLVCGEDVISKGANNKFKDAVKHGVEYVDEAEYRKRLTGKKSTKKSTTAKSTTSTSTKSKTKSPIEIALGALTVSMLKEKCDSMGVSYKSSVKKSTLIKSLVSLDTKDILNTFSENEALRASKKLGIDENIEDLFTHMGIESPEDSAKSDRLRQFFTEDLGIPYNAPSTLALEKIQQLNDQLFDQDYGYGNQISCYTFPHFEATYALLKEALLQVVGEIIKDVHEKTPLIDERLEQIGVVATCSYDDAATYYSDFSIVIISKSDESLRCPEISWAEDPWDVTACEKLTSLEYTGNEFHTLFDDGEFWDYEIMASVQYTDIINRVREGEHTKEHNDDTPKDSITLNEIEQKFWNVLGQSLVCKEKHPQLFSDIQSAIHAGKSLLRKKKTTATRIWIQSNENAEALSDLLTKAPNATHVLFESDNLGNGGHPKLQELYIPWWYSDLQPIFSFYSQSPNMSAFITPVEYHWGEPHTVLTSKSALEHYSTLSKDLHEWMKTDQYTKLETLIQSNNPDFVQQGFELWTTLRERAIEEMVHLWRTRRDSHCEQLLVRHATTMFQGQTDYRYDYQKMVAPNTYRAPEFKNSAVIKLECQPYLKVLDLTGFTKLKELYLDATNALEKIIGLETCINLERIFIGDSTGYGEYSGPHWSAFLPGGPWQMGQFDWDLFSQQIEQLPKLKRLDVNSDYANIQCSLPKTVTTVMLRNVAVFDVTWPNAIETVVDTSGLDIIPRSILDKPNIKRVLTQSIYLDA